MLHAMFVTNNMIATTVMLTVLAGNVPRPAGVARDERRALGETTAMFPDGLVHDFGTVRRGTQARHAFRIVNTSAVPLRVVSLRFG
jgi:hypothetical protein